METRDQWYKPNLLYNIHYRPPKKPEPPKMIVETVQFNPSVCTCGEHGCQPQYRMERRVLWTNKEVGSNKQQSKVNGREKRNEQFQEIGQECRFTEGGESKQMGLKENICNEGHTKESDVSNQMGLKTAIAQTICSIEGDGKKCDATESFKARESDDVGVRNSYQASDAVKEIENTEVESSEDSGADEKEKKKERYCKDEVGSNDRKDFVCNGEEVTNAESIRESDNNVRKDRDEFEYRISEEVQREKRIYYGCEKSVFNDDCNSCGSTFVEDHIDNDHKAIEDDGAIDRGDAGYVEENYSINRILLNRCIEPADFCRPESEVKCLENVEIASAFGIMSIYCNSELHSWWSFEDEDG